MKLTKKVIAGVLVAGFLAMFLVVPPMAEAAGRHWNHGGGPRHYHGRSGGYYGGPGPFWGGLAVGAVTGIVVGSIFAPRVYAAPPVVYQPAPVVVQPPPVVYQPVCSNYWVNPAWNGYQWVPGYWTQACR